MRRLLLASFRRMLGFTRNPSGRRVLEKADTSFNGLVQKRPISGNSTDLQRPCRDRQVGAAGHGLIPGERRVPEPFQPVRLGLTREQFRRAFAHAFWVFTAQETTVVQEELQQRQIVLAQVAP
jgi:hypothetical protein